MTPAPDTPDASELDSAVKLPPGHASSLGLVLGVQMLNAFNDNFVKFLLISLAPVVAGATWLGDNMELCLGVIFSLPYVLFAPVAGFLSDRHSKQRVIFWMQVLQLACFAWFAAALWLRDPRASLGLSLVGFFLLATQAALFSPAKMGIIKELVGSRRLGRASGWLQMTMMAGILCGMWAGGTWFGWLLEGGGDPWRAALVPMLAVGGLAVGETLVSLMVKPTPAHPGVRFHRGVMLEHFHHVRLLWSDRAIREAALGVMYFWFLSNAIAVILVTLSKELHPDLGQGGAARELARLAIQLGVGVIVGSLVASLVCRRGIVLGLVPLGAAGFVAGLLWMGWRSLLGEAPHWGLVFTGFAGGCYMVPLYAFVQDRAAPDERARILAAMNLLDCVAAVLAMLTVGLMKVCGLVAGWQIALLAGPTLAVAGLIGRLRRWQK